MYSIHNHKRKIILWVKPSRGKPASRISDSRAKKCPVSDTATQQEAAGPTKRSKPDTSKSRSKYSGEHNKMFELHEIVDELEKRHSTKYTIEQLRAWGNMIMMKKHDSLDHPPKKPFFKVNTTESDQLQSSTKSPGKRIHYRSECMDQLDKWHSLLTRGVITQEQYSEMQESILSDIKN